MFSSERGNNIMGDKEKILTLNKNAAPNFKDLIDGVPGAMFVYRAAKDDEEILYANNDTIKMFECDSFDDFLQHTGGTFGGIVHKDDYEKAEKSIWAQIERDGNYESVDYVMYRITTKTGAVKEIRDIGRLVRSDYYGDIFYVFLYESEKI